MSDMSVKEAYRVLQANCGIEVGDKVKVLRSCEIGEMGWGGDYISQGDLQRAVGGEAKVIGVKDDHIIIDCSGGGSDCRRGHLQVPFFCLELVEKAPKLPDEVTFTADGLTVGEVFLSKDTIRRNLDL